jgi:hypothetical protein
MVESLFQSKDRHQIALARDWKVLYRMEKNPEFDSILCTNWAIQRLANHLEKNKPFPEGDPVNSTEFTVDDFIDHLNTQYSLGLQKCDTNDANRVGAPEK